MNPGRTPLHNVAIVGAYNTVQARAILDMTSEEIILDGVRGALADAGLKAADVDGVEIGRASCRERV